MVQKMRMEPLTAAELVQLEARMSQEEMLCKTYMNAVSQVVTAELREVCGQMATRHQKNYQLLCQMLNQHQHPPQGIQ
ncbi:MULTISPECIES: hypothetical protein [Aneurinibacillus]|jgi:hypothetical protein|uniref:Spore coat protein n=1 Tax=Aneurinibacillus danicus TaxID=267746 RepID=A0A511V517_9BACL|nr:MULTISPECIES: hypothetical protein [Aneurinibacillus]GEN33191.1 hypothetical protein ADA01nite_06510 [Aneurinibacillus danicus]